MKSANKNNQKINARLQKGKAEAGVKIESLKSELTDCRRQLQQSIERIAMLEKKEANFSCTEKEAEQLKIQIKELERELTAKKKDIESLKILKQTLTEENDSLKRKLSKIQQSEQVAEKTNYENKQRQNNQKRFLPLEKPEWMPAESSEIIEESDLFSPMPDLAADTNEKPLQQEEKIKTAAIPLQPVRKIKQPIIEILGIQQFGRTCGKDVLISASSSFSIFLRIKLPQEPTVYNVDIDSPSYGVRCVITKSESKNYI